MIRRRPFGFLFLLALASAAGGQTPLFRPRGGERLARDGPQVRAAAPRPGGQPAHPDHARPAVAWNRAGDARRQAALLRLEHHGHPRGVATRRTEGLPRPDDGRRGPHRPRRHHARRQAARAVPRPRRPGGPGDLSPAGGRRPADPGPAQEGLARLLRVHAGRRDAPSGSGPTTSSPTATRSIATTSPRARTRSSSPSRASGASRTIARRRARSRCCSGRPPAP